MSIRNPDLDDKGAGDVVLKEIWTAKDALSAKFGHDIKLIMADAREREKSCGHVIVDLYDN